MIKKIQGQRIGGNLFGKYETKNPIYRLLVNNFLNTQINLIKSTSSKKILEVGCGEGYVLENLLKHFPNLNLTGIDISSRVIKIAKKKAPRAKIFVGNAHQLKFKDGSFDLVILSEVLEHLDHPNQALKEAKRVAKKYCLLNVPNEPIWRILNVLRGKYLNDLGNTPGHINHWTPWQFVSLVSRYFKIKKVLKPFPWTMVLAEKQK